MQALCRSTAGSRYRNRVLIMGSSRTNVLGRGLTLIFVDPNFLDELIEGGHARLRSGYIGSDRDYQLEDLENRRDGFGDHEAETPFEDSDSFGDFAGISAEEADSYEDDPHEDLLHRIGALKSGGKW